MMHKEVSIPMKMAWGLGLWLTLACAFGEPLLAVDADKAAHVGIAYAATTSCYGVSRKMFGLSKTDSYIFSTLLVTVVGVSKEYLDARSTNGSGLDTGDLLANSVGTAFSVATVVVFDF